MKALLIVAHGSRRKQSNDEVIEMAQKIKKHNDNSFPIVHAGFLEITEPLIPESIEKCINEGATSVTVLPYFLNSGRHVVEDIPEIVNDTKKSYPNVPIVVTPHIGNSPVMINLLLNTSQAQ